MTSNITCAHCTRTTPADEVAHGPGQWLRLSPMSRGVELLTRLPGALPPDAWTFCSSACLAAWAGDRAAETPTEAFAAEPAGLYLG